MTTSQKKSVDSGSNLSSKVNKFQQQALKTQGKKTKNGNKSTVTKISQTLKPYTKNGTASGKSRQASNIH